MTKHPFLLNIMALFALFWANGAHSDSLKTTPSYRNQLNWHWHQKDCPNADPQFSPHQPDETYRQLNISTVKSLSASQNGQKVHLHGKFSERKESRFVFQDDTGYIDVHFRPEWYCNANSAAIENTSSPAHLFGTLRQISPKVRYIEADYYQQDNLFESPLRSSQPEIAYLSREKMEKLANQGFEPAQWHLAKMYALGKFNHFQHGISEFEPNPQQAVYWWQKASENQHITARMLMWAHDEGYGGLTKNREHALALLHQSKTANNGNAHLSDVFQKESEANQLLKNQQHQQALAIYLALNAQRPDTQNGKIGEIYFDLGDYAQAHDYLEKHLAQGYVSAKFARLYVEGLGVPADVDYGLALLKQVAEYHELAALALAHYYADGRFVAKNPQLARQYYQQVMKQTQVLAYSYESSRALYEQAKMGLKRLNLKKKNVKK